MSVLDAFHLPGGWDGEIRRTAYGAPAPGVELRHPAAAGEEIAAVAGRLRAAGESLRGTPVERVIDSVDRVAERFLDPADPLRQRAEDALPAVTGYSPRMIALALDRMPADWRRPSLERLLRRNFPDPASLDGFSASPDGALLRPYPPGLVYHHLSGNVPGVGVTSLIRALLVRAPSLARTSAGEPVLPALFAGALAEHDAALGECLAVLSWPRQDAELLGTAAREAELAVVYGGDEAIRAVRASAPPRTRLLEYRHRLSIALVTREAIDAPRTAADAARAAAMFDQQGCVSPHTVFVETGSEAAADRFAEELARELDRLAGEIPAGRPSAAEAATIRAARETARFEEAAGEAVRVRGGGGAPGWSVVLDARAGFRASCLHRTVRLVPVRSMVELAERLAPVSTLLQTAGVAAPRSRLPGIATTLGEVGVLRVTSLARMPWPSPEWHHDGRPALSELVRWCEVER